MQTDFGGVPIDLGGVRIDLGGVRIDLGGVPTDLGGVRIDLGDVRIDVGGVPTDLGDVRIDLRGVVTDLAGVDTDFGEDETKFSDEDSVGELANALIGHFSGEPAHEDSSHGSNASSSRPLEPDAADFRLYIKPFSSIIGDTYMSLIGLV